MDDIRSYGEICESVQQAYNANVGAIIDRLVGNVPIISELPAKTRLLPGQPGAAVPAVQPEDLRKKGPMAFAMSPYGID